VPALTETEARARGALIDVISYEVFADLTADPVRSRTEIRFTCAEPGAATFADLTARAVSAVLNGQEIGPPDDGRLALPGLAAENTLVVEAEVDGDVLTRFTDPADGAGYLLFTGYPTRSPRLFCCFDQVDLTTTTTLSLALPAGWNGLANGPVTSRPDAGAAGLWRFGPVDGTRPFDMTIAAGPYAEAWSGTGGTDRPVRMSIWCRRSLAGTIPGLERFAGLARQALEYYERMLGVPCPYPKYDIGFVPRLDAQAISIPGLMLVNENLLARMADPDDDFVAMICAHEVSHLWFGCHISARWWDDLWLVRRRDREPGRPDRLLVPLVRPGPGRLGAGVAAHRGREHAAGLDDAAGLGGRREPGWGVGRGGGSRGACGGREWAQPAAAGAGGRVRGQRVVR